MNNASGLKSRARFVREPFAIGAHERMQRKNSLAAREGNWTGSVRVEDTGCLSLGSYGSERGSDCCERVSDESFFSNVKWISASPSPASGYDREIDLLAVTFATEVADIV